MQQKELYDKLRKSEDGWKWRETKKPVPLNFNLIELAEHIYYKEEENKFTWPGAINCNKNISQHWLKSDERITFVVTYKPFAAAGYFIILSSRLKIFMKPHTATLNFQNGNKPLTWIRLMKYLF